MPSASKRSQRCEPKKPAPPVTNTRFALVVRLNGKISNTIVANTLPRNPQFFRFDGRHLAALHDDGSLVGPADMLVDATAFNGLFANLFVGPSATPAVAGETIHLYGTGCGATDPALSSATKITGSAAVNDVTALTIGGLPAATPFVGVVDNGLCRVDAVVPSLPSGDAEAVLKIGSFVSAFGAFVTVQ